MNDNEKNRNQFSNPCPRCNRTVTLLVRCSEAWRSLRWTPPSEWPASWWSEDPKWRVFGYWAKMSRASLIPVLCDCREKRDLLHLCSWAGIRSSELAGPFSEKYENCVRFLYTWGFLVKKRDVPCPFSANSTQMSVNLGRKMSLRKLGWLDTFDREAMAAFTLWESFILLHNTLSICHTAVCLTENIRKKKQRGVQSETQ